MESQKKLKFNGKNAMLMFFLLTLVNIFCPEFVDPKLPAGEIFYILVAVFTVFSFPIIEVVDDDGKS
jgi:hypothetical protein